MNTKAREGGAVPHVAGVGAVPHQSEPISYRLGYERDKNGGHRNSSVGAGKRPTPIGGKKSSPAEEKKRRGSRESGARAAYRTNMAISGTLSPEKETSAPMSLSSSESPSLPHRILTFDAATMAQLKAVPSTPLTLGGIGYHPIGVC